MVERSLRTEKTTSADHVDDLGEFRICCIYVYDYLQVYVDQAKGLASSDPYILISLLSEDNKCFQMSQAYSKNKSPITMFMESFKYHIERSDFHLFTIWLSVWNSNPKGKDNFLGEIKIPLSGVDLNQKIWYGLKNKDSSALQMPTLYQGMLHVKLMFSPATMEPVSDATRGTLHVTIDKAKYLPKVRRNGRTDSYVKLLLRPNKTKKGFRKTKVKQNKLNPVWEEEFTYKDITWGELKTARVLDIRVMNRKMLFKDGVLGCLELGPSMTSEEVSHWEAMLKEPGKCVEWWHSLRTSTNIPRFSCLDGKQSISSGSFSTPSTNKKESNQPLEKTQATPQSPTPKIGQSIEKKKTRTQALAVSLSSSNSLTLTMQTESTSQFSPKSEKRETDSQEVQSHSSSTIQTRPSAGQIIHESLDCDSLACASSPISKAQASDESVLEDYSEAGEVLLSVQHVNEHFSVFINRARGLAHADQDGTPNPYIRTSLISEVHKYPKKRTETERNSQNPVFKKTFQYYVEQSCIGLCTLWLCVWDWDRFGKDKLLGEIKIPLSSIDVENIDGCWFKLQKYKEVAVKNSSISGQLPQQLDIRKTSTHQFEDFHSLTSTSKPTKLTGQWSQKQFRKKTTVIPQHEECQSLLVLL